MNKRILGYLIILFQGLGALYGLYSGAEYAGAAFSHGIGYFIIFCLFLLVFVLGTISCYLIYSNGWIGVWLSTAYFSAQIIMFLIGEYSYWFYSGGMFTFFIWEEKGFEINFEVGSRIHLSFDSIGQEGFLGLNIIPFIVFLILAQLGAYDKDWKLGE